MNEHWRPMAMFCGMPDGMRFDTVGRVEEIEDWGPALIRQLGLQNHTSSGWKGGFFRGKTYGVAHNHHSESRLNEFYTPTTMAMIAKKYRMDFRAFGYNETELV